MARILKEACCREDVVRKELILHWDNGAAMKGSTLLATMQWLGIVASLSRPRTSNDNPFSESLFKTLKYIPEYPERPFECLALAKDWVASFVNWYNKEHLHGGISFVTPEERHSMLDKHKLAHRRAVYAEAAALCASKV